MKRPLFLMIAFISAAHAAPENISVLWYREPAKKWTEALPVGNGRLGAMLSRPATPLVKQTL